MSQLGEQTRDQHLSEAREIIDGIPEADYSTNKQVEYADRDGLIGAVAEVRSMSGVTTLDEIDAFTARMGEIAERGTGFVVLSGDCREIVHRVTKPAFQLSRRIETDLLTVEESDIQGAEHVIRGLGQYVKPRTDREEELADGRKVPSYKGHLIHDEDPEQREPNHDYLVEGAIQARDVRESLDSRVGHHVSVMHEALSLHYELPQIHQDPLTGDEYSVSGDGLWAGVRTNGIENVIIEMLRRLRNTTGVKIDGSSDEEHIASLEEALNPNGIPGKSMYMLRLDPEDFDRYPTILKALKVHAPLSPVLFDIHGSTEKLPDGTKVRHVGNTIANMEVMALACMAAGVRFGGVSVETIPQLDRMECVDEYGQTPLKGGIDPGLNQKQFKRFLNAAAALVSYQSRLLAESK